MALPAASCAAPLQYTTDSTGGTGPSARPPQTVTARPWPCSASGREPGFGESHYGFRSLGQLLEEAEAQGVLKLERDNKSGGFIITIPQAAYMRSDV